jgi:hypothetical protein
MAGFDLTNLDAFLKEYYDRAKVEDLTFASRPLLAYLSKKKGLKGRRTPIPAKYANPRAVSSQIATSLTAASNAYSRGVDWLMTRVKLYNAVTIDRETALASDSKDGAFLSALTEAIDGAIAGTSDRLAQALYRSGWGEIGTVAASGISGSTITLANVSDAYGVEVGDVHCFSSSLNAAVLRGSATKTLTVTKVNRSTGVITYSAGVAATISGGGGSVADGDYIFTNGDREDSATPTARMVAGFEGWAPSSAPGATAWFGVDRTVDDRLTGITYNGASDDPQDAILQAAVRMGANGRTPTHAFMSFGNFAKLVQNVAVAQRFVDNVTANVQFSGVTILGPKGPIKAVPDQFCPPNRLWVLDKDGPELLYLGDSLVHVVEDSDGRRVLRQASADGEEVRVSFIGNLCVPAPQTLANVQVTAVTG